MAWGLSLLVGLALSSIIGLAGYARGALTRSGVLGAVLTGTTIFGFGGLGPAILLIVFFVSSSLLSRYQARRKDQFAAQFQKGSRRDLGQALANGGWAVLLAIGYGIAVEPQLQSLWFASYVGALATVTADTWATEIGVLSPSAPRLITTGQVVPPGTSGGITLLGTSAALAGGLLIGIAALISAALASRLGPSEWAFARGGVVPEPLLIVVAGVGGLAGSAFDSWLGATLQAIYYCEFCETHTERRVHRCGRATQRVRGWAWLDNDGVNFLASVLGSLVAALMWVSIRR